jgi:valyl-tRNA synthetase
VEAEKIRLTREITKLEQEKARSEAKLSNESFIARAPAEVVEQEKARLGEWDAKLAQLREMLGGLG